MNIKNDLIIAATEIVLGTGLAITNYRNQDASRSLEVNLFALVVIGDTARRLYQIVRNQMNQVPVIQNSNELYFSSRERRGLKVFGEMADPNDEEERLLNEAYWLARRVTKQNVELLKPDQGKENKVTSTNLVYTSSPLLKKKVRLGVIAVQREFNKKDVPQQVATADEKQIPVPEFDFKTPLIKRKHKLRFKKKSSS